MQVFKHWCDVAVADVMSVSPTCTVIFFHLHGIMLGCEQHNLSLFTVQFSAYSVIATIVSFINNNFVFSF